MNYRVGTKGQVVIAKDVRDRLGVRPGWPALQRLVNDHLEIYFVPPEHNRSLKGSLGPYTNVTIPPDVRWADIKDKAWEVAIQESGRFTGPR